MGTLNKLTKIYINIFGLVVVLQYVLSVITGGFSITSSWVVLLNIGTLLVLVGQTYKWKLFKYTTVNIAIALVYFVMTFKGTLGIIEMNILVFVGMVAIYLPLPLLILFKEFRK